jgi:DNA-binding MarR family transcriptional regulator
MSADSPINVALQSWIGVFMHRSMRSMLLYAKANGLTMPQLGAMFHILRGAGGVCDIGDDLGISSAAASQMLERLVQQDLVTRTEDPRDRRVKQIVLTEHGKQVVQGCMRASRGWLDEVSASLSPAEQEQAVAVLNILVARANQVQLQPDP